MTPVELSNLTFDYETDIDRIPNVKFVPPGAATDRSDARLMMGVAERKADSTIDVAIVHIALCRAEYEGF
jgi:hypothetical protein